LVSEGQLAWLIGASYKPGQVVLNLFSLDDLEPIEWTDHNFQPYYLTTKEQHGESVKKLNLFTGKELALQKVTSSAKPPRGDEVWEAEIYPALSYAYDKGIRFGTLHRFNGKDWILHAPLSKEQDSQFEGLFGQTQRIDPLKYSMLKEEYASITQPVPKIPEGKLNFAEVGTEEDYYYFVTCGCRSTSLKRGGRGRLTLFLWLRRVF
jgi:hypothetical protein